MKKFLCILILLSFFQLCYVEYIFSLRLSSSTRDLGINSATTALVYNSEMVRDNVGVLGTIGYKEISFAHTKYYAKTQIEDIYFVTPLSFKKDKSFLGKFNIGINFLYLHYDDINIYNEWAEIVNKTDYSFLSYKIAVGRVILTSRILDLNIGAGYNYEKDKIDKISNSLSFFDFGLLGVIYLSSDFPFYSLLGPQIRVGLTYSDSRLIFGVAAKLFKRIFFDVDIRYVDDRLNSTHFGVEVWLFNRFGIRSGISKGNIADKWAVGLSVLVLKERNKKIYLEYGQVLSSDIENIYNLGIKYRWR